MMAGAVLMELEYTLSYEITYPFYSWVTRLSAEMKLGCMKLMS